MGAACLDQNGNVVSAVSSGGIILKHPGRVGQAPVYGCGCWAENQCNGKRDTNFSNIVLTGNKNYIAMANHWISESLGFPREEFSYTL